LLHIDPKQVVMALNPFPSKPLTDIFTPLDSTIDRRTRCRIVPMSVLVLGVGRTGTTSEYSSGTGRMAVYAVTSDTDFYIQHLEQH
jgi:hypothetical protein